jgi:hypothetical protein
MAYIEKPLRTPETPETKETLLGDSLEIEIIEEDSPEDPVEEEDTDDHFKNLVEDLDESELNYLAQKVLENYDEDTESCDDFQRTIAQGLNLLGVKVEETTNPFPGACAAHHPLILESAVKFQAKASNELFNVKGPVKTQILGDKTSEKEEQAKRVRAHMNYQVSTEMTEYFEEQEQLLFYLPIIGSAFKKTYYDDILGRPKSEYVSVQDLVVNYHATSLEDAYCFTHRIHRTYNDIKKDMLSGLYAEVDLGNAPDVNSVTSEDSLGELQVNQDRIMGYTVAPNGDEVREILEQYTYCDPFNDGIESPYVITVDMESEEVLSIRRNWDQSDDALKTKLVPFSHYRFIPGMGFYGLGYIHLLGNLQMTLTSTMRSLVDSGTFANLQAGFVDKRLRIRDNDGPLSPGQFKEVESGGVNLREMIMPLPFKEPSHVLLQMYQFIEARGQKFADTTEQVVADATNYGPVGTTLALLEESQKFFSGVHKRLHRAQASEFKLLAKINYETLPLDRDFIYVGETFKITPEDYDPKTVDVIPQSDPNVNSQAQRATLAQGIYTAALQTPQIHDLYEVTKEYYSSLGIDQEKIEKFLPSKEEPEPQDPMSDIQSAQKGEPIQAFPGQDHDAHITLKQAFLNDPQGGGNPMMGPMIPIIQANIQEHIILKFQEQVSGTVAQDPNVTPESGVNEQIVAQAAQRVAQTNARMAELEAIGPDAAKNKIADAELIKARNDSMQILQDGEETSVKLAIDLMNAETKRFSEETKAFIAGFKEQQAQRDAEFNKLVTLVEKSQGTPVDNNENP